MTFYRNLVLAALILTFGVVSLGAYVRLSDAGLGCPDWPACYGKSALQYAAGAINGEQANYSNTPASHARSWGEMTHRYLTGTLGVLALFIAFLNWRGRHEARVGFGLPLVLLGLIAFQVLQGGWLAANFLKPLIVSTHLLGGMATLSLLLWLWLCERPQFSHAYFARVDHLRSGAMIGLFLVGVQIALGGWVSTNNAALACADFPLCQGQWMPVMDFKNGFTLHRELGESVVDTSLPMTALTAIHWMHRLVALIVTLYLGWLVLRLMRSPGYIDIGLMVGALLVLQWILGMSNVFLNFPLALAVAHSAGAALLLSSMVVLNYRIRRR